MFYKLLDNPVLYQYDKNRKIEITDDNMTEIHFQDITGEESITMPITQDEDGKRICTIPNKILLSGERVKIYGYKKIGSEFTITEDYLPIKKRQKPENFSLEDNTEDKAGQGNDKNYIYLQNIASDEWVVHHNLNKYPSCTIVDSGNNVVLGEVRYMDKNTTTISFSCPFSGKAIFN